MPLFRIIDRYVLQEIVGAWVAVSLILLLVILSAFLGDALGDVAKGLIPSQLLMWQVGLKSIEALAQVLPMSLFFAVMLAMGRLYRDNEMVVLNASGMGLGSLARPMILVAVPALALLMAFSLVLAPWAARTGIEQREEVTRSLSFSGLTPGRFESLPGQEAIYYVGGQDEDNEVLDQIIVVRDMGDEGERREVLAAAKGSQFRDQQTGARYLALDDGYRTRGQAGKGDLEIMSFDRHEIRLPTPVDAPVHLKLEAVATRDLFAGGAENWAELHWRLAPPITAMVLMVLAIPLSRVTPREGRAGKLTAGILVYIIYANLLGVGRVWVEQEKVPAAMGLWWVHLGILMLAVFAIRRSQSHRRRSRVGARA